MKRFTVLAAAALILAATTAEADERAERWGMGGVGAGAAAGALVAGPPGLILGSAIGGFFGERMGRARTASDLETELAIAVSDADLLRAALKQAERETNAIRADLEDREHRIAELQHSRRVATDLETEVLFRTGSSTLESSTDPRLDGLAGILRDNPDLSVRLDGYADPRGGEEFNLDLSRDRAAAVRDALVFRGVAADRIAMRAHGDRTAVSADGDLDAYALERRVQVRLSSGDPEATVARQP